MLDSQKLKLLKAVLLLEREPVGISLLPKDEELHFDVKKAKKNLSLLSALASNQRISCGSRNKP